MTDEHEKIFMTGAVKHVGQWLIQISFRGNHKLDRYWSMSADQDEALRTSKRWHKAKSAIYEIRKGD